MRYWLMKSEPSELGIDDLAALPSQASPWCGVRNYQARNFLRDEVHVGDLVFFYHSSCAEPGIAGVAKVVKSAYPDPSQFDPDSPYVDPKASLAAPRWFSVDVALVRKTRLVSLKEMRADPALASMRLLAKGRGLSVLPVDAAHWARIVAKMATLA